MSIRSHRGPYRVVFGAPFEGLEKGLSDREHLLVDARVAELYARELALALAGRSVLRIEATEAAKSLERLPAYATHLIERGVRRDHALIAVGGGIVQDITAFLAATLLRGMPWRFHPTTLLAQADSCIGSKSSINVGPHKNQLGTFTPPEEIRLSLRLLKTLDERDLRSGIGEMIKVHVLSGWDDARRLLADFPRLKSDPAALERTLVRSLEIKKRFIEADEFDRGERLVMNYGHTFGHAIEGATDYAVPHGIAVTLGMSMANALSVRRGLLGDDAARELGAMLQANAAGFEGVEVPFERFLAALSKDKKAAGAEVRFVLLKGPGRPVLERLRLDEAFQGFCRDWFRSARERSAAGARP